MTHKQRLRSALDHREGDRVPLDLGSTKMTGISMTAYRNYLEHTAKTHLDSAPEMLDLLQQLAKPSEAFLEALDVDVRGVFPAPARPMDIVQRGEYLWVEDEWGIGWKMPADGGLYYDLSHSPMKGDELTAGMIDGFPFPDPLLPCRTETLSRQAETYGDAGLTMHGVTSGVLEMALRLRGFQNFFVDMMVTPDMAGALLDRITDIKIAYWQSALAAAGGGIDVAVEPDDLGTQNSLLVAPDTYRALLKPRHTRLFQAIKKAAPHIKVFLHSCGAVRPLIPDIIETGVDILNPVQVSAADMDIAALKREFGGALVFWGGGIDTQSILPGGTPAQIDGAVHRAIDTLAPGGGFVFNTVHNIQADVPPENLDALFMALEKYR